MKENIFKLVSPFKPMGDQIKAIEKLSQGVKDKYPFQTLMGVTGSGKTFTMANIIAEFNKPTLILAHNKTLAAQLYGEFKAFFPENAVEYFVSYYDYYQPEAYIPGRDLYVEKSALINEEIDRLRLHATKSLFERNDVIVIASVSAIYGLGSEDAYFDMLLLLEEGKTVSISKITEKLVQIQYKNNPLVLEPGTFRVLGDVLEIFPPYEERNAIRISLFGNEIESIYEIDSLTRKNILKRDKAAIYPATHFAITDEMKAFAIQSIMDELQKRLKYFETEEKIIEFTRLKDRTMYDVEMIESTGYCNGVENYSRHFTGRKEGDAPPTLIDYFPNDYLLFVDESHVTIPQVRGMYLGDKSRKQTLVDFGFRLPSALDNRPLKFEEFEKRCGLTIFVSATPAIYEKERSSQIAEQIIRPTGLLDPVIEIRKTETEVDDLLNEIQPVIDRGEKIFVTVLTKKMAEHLTDYYQNLGVRVKYLHSDIDTLERVKILKEMEEDEFDVLVGINLLREGLDAPMVSLVAIFDADKEGFLRSERSLIQTIGRASRNQNGKVILYADVITDSMKKAIEETERRRDIQEKHNNKYGITPKTVIREKKDPFDSFKDRVRKESNSLEYEEDIEAEIKRLEKEMRSEAGKLNFENAAFLRDQIAILKKRLLEL
ncbi:excinuclease ABC subunit UvrB [bacterium]|nr:excinuclease ABC subunit UvrB [bacterium]